MTRATPVQRLIDRRRYRQRQMPGAAPGYRARLEREIAEITGQIRAMTDPGREHAELQRRCSSLRSGS